MQKKICVFTIGHSTRTIEEFLEILKHYHITELVDIRTIPKSRHNPQFNGNTLAHVLRNHHIGYRHEKHLGGLRHAHKDSVNMAWENLSFRGYADYMQTDEFANALQELIEIADTKEKDLVTMHDFEEARDKVLLGKEVKSIMLTPEDKKLIAYHESGHALVRLLLPENSDPLHKVTIIPRGSALGVTHSLPEREKYITTKEEMEASVMSALGGRVAEEIIFNTLTTGAYSDFQTANRIVRNMVCHYGMSPEIGTIIYSQHHGDFEYSQKTAEKIDAEVQRLTALYHDQTRTLLEANRDKLDTLATALMEKETMSADEIYALLGITPRTAHALVS